MTSGSPPPSNGDKYEHQTGWYTISSKRRLDIVDFPATTVLPVELLKFTSKFRKLGSRK